jgi:hypothetical protein
MDQPSINQQDESGLLSALRVLFQSDDVLVGEWTQRSPGTPGTTAAAVSRWEGTARVKGQLQSWSLIRKALTSPESRQVDPTDPTELPSSINYWKREFCAYQSDLLKELPLGFTRPRCLNAQESEDECVLWLEVLKDEIEIWPLERYGLAARHLGMFNGLSPVAQKASDYPWLSVEINRQRERNNGEMFAKFDELRQHPIVRRGWPDDVADGIIRIWQERERFYQALRTLPQVLQHGDAGRRNLMALVGKNGEAQTGAIDWGYMGTGTVGEEIAATVVSPLIWFQGVEPEELLTLEAIVLEGYSDGLRAAGWRGDLQLARLGYLCTVALRYGPNIVFPEILAMDAKVAEGMQQRFGWSIEAMADRLVPIRRFVIQRADQARQLMEKLK